VCDIRDELMPILGTADYPYYPYVHPPATEEEKRQREIRQMEQQEYERQCFERKHNAEMAEKRQEQDFYLAMCARIAVGVVLCVALWAGCVLGVEAVRRYKGVQVVESGGASVTITH
jgi:hypothetical protein